jgi:hypothetical protein
MTEVDGSAAPGGRRSLPWWGVVILAVAVVGSTVGWYIDRAADHPALVSPPKQLAVAITVPVWVGGSSATVVAVTGPRDLVLDIGPTITQPGLPSSVRLSDAPPLPAGRTSVRLTWLGTPAPTNCHASEAQQLAVTVITPDTHVIVRAVEVSTTAITVDMWRTDGTDISTQLVAAGVAPAWTGQGGVVRADQSAAMRAAQDKHLGIWAPCGTPG